MFKFFSNYINNFSSQVTVESNIVIEPLILSKLLNLTTTAISSGEFYFFEMLGFYSYLQESGFLPSYQWITCSSAGSLVGLILACNIRVYNYFQVLIERYPRIQILKSSPLNGYNFVFNSYLQKRSQVKEDIIRLIIREAFGKDDVTFEELYQKTGKNFFVVLTNLRTTDIQYASYFHSPKLSVFDAVNASSQVPYFMAPIKLNINGREDWFLDGSLIDSYPIDAYLSKCSKNNLQLGSRFKLDLPDIKTFMGLKVFTPSIRKNPYLANTYTDYTPVRDVNLIETIQNISIFRTYGQETSTVEPIRKRTIFIEGVKKISLTETISTERIVRAFNSGAQSADDAVRNFIQSGGEYFNN